MNIKKLNSLFILVIIFFTWQGKIFAADPTITFQMGSQTEMPFSVPESTRLIELVAVLSEPFSSEVTFTYELLQLGTTATRNSDFQFNTEDDPSQRINAVNVTFGVGETLLPIPIVIIDDRIKEDDEIIRFLIKDAPPGFSIPENPIDIQIVDDEANPIIVLTAPNDSINAAVDEGNGIELTLEIINNSSSKDIEVIYEIIYTPATLDGEENDYGDIVGSQRIDDNRGILTIEAIAASLDVDIFIKRDGTPEEQEELVFKLISATNGVVHETQNIIYLTINDMDGNAGAINDTGVTQCYDDNKALITGCNSAEFPDQDGDNVDNTRLKRFVKLNSNGIRESAPDTYTEWACVLDENTNLVWQVKASEFDFDTRDESSYTWFNSISNINGGNEGFAGSGSSDAVDQGEASCSSGICNTTAYASRVSSSLCGPGNWRVPSLTELLSIIDFESVDVDVNGNEIVTSAEYFKHTIPSLYWTSTPASLINDSAWCLHFGKILQNHARLCKKEEKHFLRLVKTYKQP